MSAEQFKTLHSFVIDSAKIVFGSLVVGVFLPRASGEMPWFTFFVGVIFTAAFLGIALSLSKRIN